MRDAIYSREGNAMDKKQLMIFGGAAVAIGGVAIYALSRNRVAGVAQTPPAVQSLGIPTMPTANIQPAPINIVDTPYTLNFNMPDTRDIQPPESKDDCPCKGKCDGGLSVYGPKITPEQTDAYIRNASRSFAAAARNGNMMQQFPPELFPYLYENGGNA